VLDPAQDGRNRRSVAQPTITPSIAASTAFPSLTTHTIAATRQINTAIRNSRSFWLMIDSCSRRQVSERAEIGSGQLDAVAANVVTYQRGLQPVVGHLNGFFQLLYALPLPLITSPIVSHSIRLVKS